MSSMSHYTKLPTTKKQHRSICRYGYLSARTNTSTQQLAPGQADDSSGSGSGQRTRTSPDISDGQVKELEETLPRFGPLCGEDGDRVKVAKKEAWKHIVAKALEEERDSLYGNYYLAVEEKEAAARAAYDSDSDLLQHLMKSEFLEMMIMDGCFFLQLALFILGGSKPLDYPDDHPYFRSDNHTENRRIKAMFFVGNQVPYVVLRRLMEQAFFQKVIAERKWSMPSDDLPKMALYLLVVSPHLEEKKAPYYFHEEPAELLHALHCLVVGPGIGDDKVVDDSDDERDLDLEAGTEEEDNANNRDVFPSATELEQAGIKLVKAEGGIRKICFCHWWLFHGRLYVPPFAFGRNPELILRYLKEYEIAQKQGKNNSREVAAYLCFMRDLVRTPMDVFVLQRSGIIQRQNRNPGDKLPRMLRRLCSEETALAQNVFLAKIAIKEYGSPHRRFIIKVTLFLTLIQAVFAVLSYIPRK